MRATTKILIVTLAMTIGLSQALWAAEPAKPADAKQAEKKPGIVAVVNGTEVPLDDFYREMLRLERLVLNTGKPLSCPQVTRLRKDVAEGLVRRELLYQESKSKIKVTDAEIATEVKKLKDQYASEKDFTAALGSMNVSQAFLRAQVERTLSIRS